MRRPCLKQYCWALLAAVSVGSHAQSCRCEILTLHGAVQESTDSSFDIKLANVKALELHSDIRAARADYFPTLQAVATGERDLSLKNSAQQVLSVNNSTFNALTRFQALGALQSTVTLFDFGVRTNTLRAAKRAYESAAIYADAAKRDLRLAVIETYSQALSTYKSLKARERVLPIYQELFNIKKQTYQAGAISRTELGEQLLQLDQAQDSIQELRENLTERLNELALYTHHSYSIEDLEMEDLDGPVLKPSVVFEPHLTPDYAQYQKQIQARQAELRAMFAQRLPQVRAYAGYVIYGTNKNSFNTALSYLGQRMFDAGIAVSWTLFDGLKTSAQCERKKYEIKELELHRDKRISELQNQYNKANETLRPLTAQLTTKIEVVTEGERQVDRYERLSERRVSDRTVLLNERVQLIERQLAADKVRIQRAAALEKVRVLTGT